MAGPQPGDPAPAFRALDQDRREHTLDAHKGSPFVLYFYPKDETLGCTAEACGFRDAWDDFRALGVEVLGVSRDGVGSHKRFAENRRIPFTLLSDRDGSMHRDYGALYFGALPKRISFLVDADGRVVERYDSRFRATSHVDHMLESARRLVAGVENAA